MWLGPRSMLAMAVKSRDMLTQGLLANRNHNVFEVGRIVDKDQQLISAIEKNVIRNIDGEASVSSAVGIDLLAIDLVHVRNMDDEGSHVRIS